MSMTDAVTPEPGEDENLVVELKPDDEDVKAAPDGAKPPPVPGPSTPPTDQLPHVPSPPLAPETGLAELKSQVEAERQARARAEAVAAQARREAAQAVAFAQEAERRGMSTLELYTENQITSLTEQMEGTAREQEAAMGDGDFKLAAQLNLKLGKLGGQLAQEEARKVALQQQRERVKAQPQRPAAQPQPQQPQIPSDPVERALYGRSEATKGFLRKHKELIRGDGTLKRAAIDAHESALDAGHAVDTPGYFDHIEKLISTNGAVQAPAQGTDAPTRPQQPYAAPVARGGPTGPSVPGMMADGRFQLTPKMRRLAAEQGVTPAEWATNYVRLLKEGRITPIT